MTKRELIEIFDSFEQDTEIDLSEVEIFFKTEDLSIHPLTDIRLQFGQTTRFLFESDE